MKQSTVAAIENLVLVIAEKSSKSAKNLKEQLEALRVLAPYYAALKRHKGSESDTATDEVTISHLRNAVRQIEDNNGGTVPDHQRGHTVED